MSFPENFLDLLHPAARALLYLATIMPDGSPQLTPVWFDVDGDDILINTNEGRVKDMNMKTRKNVAIVIQASNDPYRYLGIRGVVVGHTRDGADEHIAMLSMRYDNKPWKRRENQRRIIFRIKPTSFDQHN